MVFLTPCQISHGARNLTIDCGVIAIPAVARPVKKTTKNPTFLSHAAVQRRISTKLCTKIEDVRTILHPF